MDWTNVATWLLITVLIGVVLWLNNKMKSSDEAYALGMQHGAEAVRSGVQEGVNAAKQAYAAKKAALG